MAETIATLRCGFVGTGTMSAAMVRGLCTLATPPTSVIVSPRNAEKAAALQREFPGLVTVASDNQDVVDRCDVVFIGVLPAITEETVRALRLQPGRHTIISLVSTATLDQLHEWCAPLSPDDVARAIPLPPVAKHRGASLLTPPHPIGVAIFDALGSCVAVEEEATLKRLLCVSCLMGNIYSQQNVTQQWLVEQGVPVQKAATFVGAIFHTVSFDAAKPDEGTFAELVAEQTPGGLNEQVAREMKEAGMHDALRESLDGCLARIEAQPRPKRVKRPYASTLDATE